MSEFIFTKDEAVGIKVLEVNQPIGKFYIGVASASNAVAICSANARNKDELEEYIGIQRPLNPERVKEIKKYVQTWDASFPNSVILAVRSKYFFFEDDCIYIYKNKISANIIDGQHRLAGFDEENGKDFDVILALFPELELEEQAYLFSVINTKMTRINPSLAQDLYAFATINTPAKLVHNIAKNFNQDSSNPWYQKIKMLGRRELNTDSVLSQSTFSKEILKLVCDKGDSYEIRHILKVNDNDRSSLNNFYDTKKSDKYILWMPFVKNEDKFIFTILRDYFLTVQATYADEWDDATKILTKTTGYSALMMVFDKLCREGFKKGELTRKFFEPYFEAAKASGEIKDLISDNYKPGGIGERDLFEDFLSAMNLG